MTHLRIVSLALVALLALPAVAAAKNEGRKVTVMTRNVYLGADLAPAIQATTLPQAIDGAGTIWNELQTHAGSGSAPCRSRARSGGRSADLVGLQEVALWRKQTPSDLGAPPLNPNGTPATQVELDFLAILRKKLKGYRVVVVQKEFEAELPVDQDANDATGGALRRGLRRAAHDARRDPGQAGEQGSARQDAEGQLRHQVRGQRRRDPDPGRPRLDLRRGALPARQQGAQVPLREHAPGGVRRPAIREAQANELVAGPLDTSRQVILVGDLNSGVARHNEPEQPGDDLAFRALAGFGMKDKGAVQSCCYDDMFDRNAVFDHTVDHVLTKPGLRKRSAFVTGDDRGQRTPAGLWPSDHGGVVSRLLLRR